MFDGTRFQSEALFQHVLGLGVQRLDAEDERAGAFDLVFQRALDSEFHLSLNSTVYQRRIRSCSLEIVSSEHDRNMRANYAYIVLSVRTDLVRHAFRDALERIKGAVTLLSGDRR